MNAPKTFRRFCNLNMYTHIVRMSGTVQKSNMVSKITNQNGLRFKMCEKFAGNTVVVRFHYIRLTHGFKMFSRHGLTSFDVHFVTNAVFKNECFS